MSTTNSIKCPKCGEVFTVNEADYASIVSQIRTREYQQDLASRTEEVRRQLKAEQEAQALKESLKFKQDLLTSQNEISAKELEIDKLQSKLNEFEHTKKLELQAQVFDKETTILNLQNTLQATKAEATLREKNLTDNFQQQLKQQQEMVEYYKDLKTRMSTKMIGETLEIHCSTEFNRLRTVFPNAYFEKDNDASSGSKGDFIFRDYDSQTEYVSIMFEMKNEMDQTATKHKNEDFLKKLDEDRRTKNCEYAVLVSLLEPDSELYNGGIVDMTYRYPKMYVIRPQFFIPLITLLCQTSKKSLEYKKELAIV